MAIRTISTSVANLHFRRELRKTFLLTGDNFTPNKFLFLRQVAHAARKPAKR